jgi:helix-turn-helix protein
MAVMTFTRRQVVDMIPEFLTRRVATFGPVAKARAEELGISEGAFGVLNGALAMREGDRVTRSRYAFRSPYAIHRPAIEKAWDELVAAGLADTLPVGWRLHSRTIEIAEDAGRRLRAFVRALPFPAAPTARATKDLTHLADRVPPAAERTELVRRLVPGANEPASDATALSRAAQILWAFRDDCHIPAWQAAGYEGPAFDVLSYVWASRSDVSHTRLPAISSLERLVTALAPRQERTDVERNVAALVARGDMARDGDAIGLTEQGRKAREAIEEDTDRRYFAIWDLDDAGTSRVGDDLRAIIDALPRA